MNLETCFQKLIKVIEYADSEYDNKKKCNMYIFVCFLFTCD